MPSLAGAGAGIHPASFDLDALRAYRRAPSYAAGLLDHNDLSGTQARRRP